MEFAEHAISILPIMVKTAFVITAISETLINVINVTKVVELALDPNIINV